MISEGVGKLNSLTILHLAKRHEGLGKLTILPTMDLRWCTSLTMVLEGLET